MRRLLFTLAFVTISGCAAGSGGNPVPAPLIPPQTSSAAPSALPKHYVIVDLGARVRPAAVNALGTVVGTAFSTGSPDGIAFRYKNGRFTTLGMLQGATSSAATDINDGDLAVGTSGTDGVAFEPSGALVDLGTPPNTYAQALTVNDSGEIAGIAPLAGIAGCGGNLTFFSTNAPPKSVDGSLYSGTGVVLNSSGSVIVASYQQTGLACQGTISAVNYPAGTFVALPAALDMDARYAAITDINDSGDIVGYSPASNAPLAAFYVHQGVAMEIPPPPGDDTIGADAINDSGWIVGFEGKAAGSSISAHAFVWIAGTATDLNTVLPAGCGWVLESAADINGAGIIVGTGTLNGAPHGFMLVPAP